jgi:heme-degrading monooxygenase HmoA
MTGTPGGSEDVVIARTWRGTVRAEDAETYLGYLQETGLAAYRGTPGNEGLFALRRIDGDRCEFLLLTLWDSMDAIKGFAGSFPERAVFYPEDDRYLIDRDLTASHWEVVAGP